MSNIFKVSIDFNEKSIQQKVDNLLIDDTLMLQIHAAFERYCEPYVPYLHGPLSRTAQASADGVKYTQPYAHYQYVGEHFNHTKTVHPKATAYWDKVMMSEQGEQFCKEVEALIQRRAKELYG